jgi:LemA protein
MDLILILIVGIVAIFFIVIIINLIRTYNRLIKLNIDVDRQLSHVQVHLKKKFDMIPALTEAVKGYAKHEAGTLKEVTGLRSQWGEARTPESKVKAANQLEAVLSKLMVIQERYPRLKADRSFQHIMHEIGYVERELTLERKVYNKRVSWYNLQVKQFPSNIIAGMFGFKERSFYQRGTTEDIDERENPLE